MHLHPGQVDRHAGEQPQPAAVLRGQPAAYVAGDLVTGQRRDLPALARRGQPMPAGQLLAGHPLPGELQRGRAVVDDGHLGDPADADDHLDHPGERVADDQPLDTAELDGQRPHGPGHRGAAQPRLVPGDLVTGLAGPAPSWPAAAVRVGSGRRAPARRCAARPGRARGGPARPRSSAEPGSPPGPARRARRGGAAHDTDTS